MKFRTELKSPAGYPFINHQSNILLIGSCFTDHIGSWLKQHFFRAVVNPFGTVYNPVSINHLFTPNPDQLVCNHTIYHNYQWASLHHHSSNNQFSEIQLINHLKHIHTSFYNNLKTSNFLFITLGTAWVYTYLKTGQVVSNCQKLPAKEFIKHLLDISAIKEALTAIINKVPINTFIIFTISPVRHLKDGFVENNRSKARLIEAVHLIVEQYPNRCYYFPVYEWFMDDLRDYRFYGSDLIHPNEQGVAYILDRFKECFFSKETQNILSLIIQYNQLANHRPIVNNTQALNEVKNKLDELKHQINQMVGYALIN